MPYKQKLKTANPNPRAKPSYKVTNWGAYKGECATQSQNFMINLLT